MPLAGQGCDFGARFSRPSALALHAHLTDCRLAVAPRRLLAPPPPLPAAPPPTAIASPQEFIDEEYRLRIVPKHANDLVISGEDAKRLNPDAVVGMQRSGNCWAVAIPQYLPGEDLDGLIGTVSEALMDALRAENYQRREIRE